MTSIQSAPPLIKYHLSGSPSNEQYKCIEVDGNVIHRIDNLSEFYSHFGYTNDLQKVGVAPEEFIWDEYIKDKEESFKACMQMHIIEYLRKNSQKFMEMYGAQCASWFAAHAEARSARGTKCAACKLLPYCEDEQT